MGLFLPESQVSQAIETILVISYAISLTEKRIARVGTGHILMLINAKIDFPRCREACFD